LPVGAQYVEYAGSLYTYGLLHFIHICAHEAGHKSDYDEYILLTPEERPLYSHDGDGISDLWEQNHHFNPNDPDTTRAYGGAYQGDSEALAEIHAWGVVQPLKQLWHSDWSHVGLQSGAWGPNNPAYYTYFGLLTYNTPYHPWYYIASGGSQQLLDPPADALTALP
jgi:hypothetical protein